MNRVITEITPLQEEDCFYLIDRYKESFTYPIHKHEEVELNFVQCHWLRRLCLPSWRVPSPASRCS